MTKSITQLVTHAFLLTVLLALSLAHTSAQQTIQLYYEDFNGTTAGFTLNSPTNVSSATGPNQWIINSNYSGGGLYQDTPDETQTQSGTIAGAPYSNYLHVHDANSAAICTNANYDPTSASDQMAVMNTSFCTLSLTDVTLTFFYIGDGNATDNLKLYYSTDGGTTWIQTGQSAYYGQSLWKYEIVTDPGFNNQLDLRFAWRWTNGTGAAPSIGFGIDDIIAVGTYDNINNPVQISIDSVAPNPVCQGGYLFIYWHLSAPLCDGIYDIKLSNSSGNFFNPTDLGVFNIPAGTLTGGIAAIIPFTTLQGSCYKVEIIRVSPAPTDTGTASTCFTVQACPNVITTLQPVVTYGPDSLCVNSVIDVPFYSTGTYNFNNQYIAELSDASGSFSAPTTIGSVLDPTTYDPMYGSPPGTVSGLVPNVPDGCGYMVRVRSTAPVATGSPWGPFCIHHCDETTNNMQDISVCISDNVGVDTTIHVEVNTWNSNTTYLSGNQFEVQVLSSKTYAILSTGDFGSIASTTSCDMPLNIPGLNQLIPILGYPGVGMYYMRVIATNPSPSSNNLGSLVHLTIGHPDSIPPAITPDDTIVCNNTITGITINPFNMYTTGSQYEWYSPNLNSGLPFFWAYNPILISWNGTAPGTYWFTVREFNYGCYGPWSDTVYIQVIGTPSQIISGPISVCVGDTVTYTTSFLAGTYYDWTGSLLSIIDTANNEVTVVFDTVGTAHLNLFALNMCGQSNGTKTITVHALPTPPVITQNNNILTSSSASNYQWYLNGSIIPGATNQTLIISQTGAYSVVVSNSNGCKAADTLTVNPFVGFVATDPLICEKFCISFTDQSTNNPISWQWSFPGASPSSSTDQNPANICYNTTGLYDVTLITTNASGNDTLTLSNYITVYATPPFPTITQNGYVLTSSAAAAYQWQYNAIDIPGATNQSYTVTQSGLYTVMITDGNGCLNSGSKYVEITGIAELNDGSLFISPSLSNGNISIEWINSLAGTKIFVEVTNSLGQKVFSSVDYASSSAWKKEINVNNLARGMYLVSITSEGKRVVAKVILQ
jgi:PKD repeat protein